MRPREYERKQGRNVSLTVQLHCGGFLTDSHRSAQNFWLKLPLYRKHPLSHFLAQSKSFPVGVQQKKTSLVHFALPPTAALLIGISSYGASRCGWWMRNKWSLQPGGLHVLKLWRLSTSIVKWLLRGRSISFPGIQSLSTSLIFSVEPLVLIQ